MSLIKNSIWNFSGYILPTLVAVPALGLLARILGAERFGLFTICTAVVGYASIFDAGLTRAVIREISIYRDNFNEKMKIISTSTTIVFMLGMMGSLILYLNINSIIGLLKVSSGYIDEVSTSFKILACTVPLFLLNQIWVSFLEGEENFLNINIQRCISSSLIAGLPALFVIIHPTLTYAMLGMVLGRGISLLISYYCARKLILKSGFKIYKDILFRLLRFGGWITISNIISPIMSYFDRFIVSNIIGAKSVGFYSAPSEMVNRLTNIPWALARALFPKLSSAKTVNEKRQNEFIAYALMTCTCLPIVFFGALFAHFILNVWVGATYADKSSTILQILLIGFAFNAYAQIPFATIQASGKAKITAIIHCIEIVPYLALLYWMINHYGLVGAAVAWTMRVIIDFIILFSISVYMRKHEK
ncbi:TPA: flippase [Citrobacter freundii]|uniref:Putative O-antigen transporter n=1 Tax=uncultured Citrobacter sp. TaxID=200446 RepID=A0A212IPH2_9ENTR|nr:MULTISPECIES: flippase [Citrobacter]EKQ7210249.1 flippase [Citrobacter freundii]EKV5128601.1 flippase [Citrobacter freundii]ELZ9357963.1 flippase [Citrobacter freundii]KKJ90898.1 transporter [Citrobacter freundii]MBJ9531289.1 flippase [Citrobacter freundii]